MSPLFFVQSSKTKNLNSSKKLSSPQIRDDSVEIIKVTPIDQQFLGDHNANLKVQVQVDLWTDSPLQPVPVAARKEKGERKHYLGLVMTLVAGLNLSCGVLFAKLLQSFNYHGNCASFWRYVGITVPSIPLLVFYECTGHESTFTTLWPLNKNDNWKTALGVLLRGTFAATAVVLRYYALEYLPIGDTLVIAYSTPVLVTILAHIFLGEKAGLISYVVAAITLIGVVIVAKPPMLTGQESLTSETLTGIAFALASLILSSTQIILTRKVRSVHYALLTITGGLIGLIIAGCIMIHYQDFQYPLGLTDGLYVGGLATTSFFGQIALILALKFEKAGPVSILRSCDILFGFLLQYFFLHVIPEWTSLTGAGLVICGVTVIGLRKWLQSLPRENRMRTNLRFLLL